VKKTSWLALLVLVPLIAFVVWTSFDVGATRCEVCITFRGQQACRAVDGATEEAAMAAARTNACALLASGVTDSMACERTPPTRSTCALRR
jgi:hypothetical protein